MIGGGFLDYLDESLATFDVACANAVDVRLSDGRHFVGSDHHINPLAVGAVNPNQSTVVNIMAERAFDCLDIGAMPVSSQPGEWYSRGTKR